MIRLRHTAGLTLLIAAAAAVIALPSPSGERVERTDPFRLQVSAAEYRLRHASELLRREDSRSLARAAAAQPVNVRTSMSFVRMPGATVGFEEWVHAIVDRENAAWPRRDSTIRTLIVLVADTGAAMGDVPSLNTRNSVMSVDVFPPGTVAKNVCVAVARAHYAGLLMNHARESHFDPSHWNGGFSSCQWYGQFGAPGRGVATWLDSTRFAPIVESDFWAFDWRPARFGFYDLARRPGTWASSDPSRYVMAACADGNNGACDKLFLSNIEETHVTDGSQIRTSAWIGRGRAYNIAPNRSGAALLHRLQYELGTEQFAAFWKSDAPVPDAFHAIRGGSFTDWIREQTVTVVPAQRDRAIPSITTLIAFVFGVAGLLFFGTRAVARRSGFA